MLKKHVMLALLGTALLAIPAAAQTGSSPSSSPPAASGSGSMNQPSASGSDSSSSQPSASGSGSSSSQPSASGSSSSSGATSSQSSASAPSSGSAQFITKAETGQWRASKLVGVNVYGQNNEKIGDVKEVVVDKSGNAKAIVIGVGGFLGIGEKNVAVPFNALQWSDQPLPSATTGASSAPGASANRPPTMARNPDYPDHATLNMTKDQLTNAPDFKYASDTSSGTSR